MKKKICDCGFPQSTPPHAHSRPDTLEKMTLDDKVSWAMGEIVMAIGAGQLRSKVAGIIMAIMTESYNRGRKAKKGGSL